MDQSPGVDCDGLLVFPGTQSLVPEIVVIDGRHDGLCDV